jgi:hypothetical protein
VLKELRMRLPRKRVLIRVLIYVPLLGYFGWQALDRWRAEQVAHSPEPSVEEKLAPHKKWMTFPDGTKQEIYELTPEEAADILGHEPPERPGADQARQGPGPADDGSGASDGPTAEDDPEAAAD